MVALPALLREAGRESDRLPSLVAAARRAAATLRMGTHGLRRAGPGETFWQHRDHRPEEGLSAVDWRRSARGDRLYARDREREAPALMQLWTDGRSGMAWASADTLPPKADVALTALLALGMALRGGGEHVAAISRPPTDRDDRLAIDLLATGTSLPAFAPVSRRHGLILATDGLERIALWADRFAALRSGDAPRLLLLVADPAEEDFPFQGRVQFRAPGAPDEPILIGRSESAAAAYRRLWRQHREALIASARASGFSVATTRTDRPLAPALLQLAHALGPESGR